MYFITFLPMQRTLMRIVINHQTINTTSFGSFSLAASKGISCFPPTRASSVSFIMKLYENVWLDETS